MKASESDRVIVTGTRIKRTEFALPVPAQVLDSAAIDIAGANELSEAIVELPAITPSITTETSQSSTQNSGLSTVSLRNLGSSRTLTLIDGRRTVGNTPTGSTVSFSTIPDSFVERVEVITGGASALYGSDAVTGVINVIMKDDFEGLSFESRVGTSNDGGNTEYGIEIAAGGNFADGRGNVMLAFEYDTEGPIREFQRDLANDPRGVDTDDNGPDEFEPNFTSNIPGGLFAGNEGDALNPDRDSTWWYFGGGDFTGPLTEDFSTDDNGFNFLGPETISIPRDRMLFAGKMDYDLSDSVRFFASAQYSHIYTKSERVADTASSSRLGGDFPIFLADGVTPHPFVPQEIFDDAVELGRDDITFRRSWLELGNRFREADNDTLRVWAGFDGVLDDNWSWEVNFGYGEFRRAQSRVGDLVIPNYLQAINVEFIDAGDPSQGLQCADANARSAGCVPLDVFGIGAVSPEAAEWIILRDQLRARNRTTTAQAWITGDLVDLWAGPLSVAAGYDYRREASRTRWDPISTSGGGTVTQQVNQDGLQDVHEGFVEAVMPLASGLAAEGAVRVSDYSTIGTVLSWKAGGTWQPVEDIRFRGVFAVSNRAPNNIELFSRGVFGQGGLGDPCDMVTATSTGIVDETCRQDPVVAAVISSNGVFEDLGLQVQQPVFGNLDLEEETSRTVTAGIVLTPSFAPGLSISADYYRIKIEGAISEIDSSDIVDFCYTSGNFAGTASCALIERDAADDGRLDVVPQTSLNVDELRTEGIDVTMQYWFEPAASSVPLLNAVPGDVTLTGTFSRVLEFVEEAPIPGTNETLVTDELGLTGLPKFRGRFGVRWEDGPLSVSWRTLVVGSMLNDNNERTRLSECIEFDNCDEKIALFLPRDMRHNIRVSYDVGEFVGGDANVYFGINNLLNNQGPSLFDINENVGENSHSLYDITGRFFYGGVRLNF